MSDFTRFTAWMNAGIAVMNLFIFAVGGLAGTPRWWWLLIAAGWALVSWGNFRLADRQRKNEPAAGREGASPTRHRPEEDERGT